MTRYDLSMTTKDLRTAASRLPRVTLAHLPTPLEELPRFSAALGGPRVLIKRDDCTGLAMGGNKTRHNEFLMGAAVAQKADVVVWGAGTQSNNCRQTAAACAKLGIECHLYLSRAVHDDDIQGNLLLDHILGAKVTIVDEPMGPALDDLLLAKAEEFRKAGRRPYVWDRVTGRPLAAVSYALCFAEILDQLTATKSSMNHIYAAAAGATGGGLLLGKSALDWPGKVKLLCPIYWPWNIADDLADIANQVANLLELPNRVQGADVDVSTAYIGPKYGSVTPACKEALLMLARTEGIVLDSVYTAKALASLIDDARSGKLTKNDTVVFLHTGGATALFAYRDDLLPL